MQFSKRDEKMSGAHKIHTLLLNREIIAAKKLITKLDNVNERDAYQQTLLHLACGAANSPEIVTLLLDKKADINVQDRNGWTPLHCSANEGHLDICEKLLKCDNIDVGVLNKDGTSVLHYLVRINPADDKNKELYANILKLYIEKRGDLSSQTRHGIAPLHDASLRGNLPAVKFLIDHGAGINILNKFSSSPFFSFIIHFIYLFLLNYLNNLQRKTKTTKRKEKKKQNK